MSSIGVQKKCNQHLRRWMETKNMLQNMENTAIESCTELVLKLIGSKIDLLGFIIKFTSIDELNKIYDILKAESTKYKNDNVQNDNNNNSEPADNATLEWSTFNVLSKQSISHICGFLNRAEIKTLKVTSCRISIICLEEMEKISVGVCNTNKLLNNNEYNRAPLSWDNLMSYSRYNHNTKYNILYDQFNHKIPEISQIKLAIQQKRKSKYKHVTIDKSASIEKFDVIEKNRSFILFDSRKLVHLNQH